MAEARVLLERLAKARPLAPGVGFCLLVATAAAFLAESRGGPVILYALLLGMAFNFLGSDARFAPGVAFAGRSVLRLGVALLGARITLAQIAAVGAPMMIAIALCIAATIGFGWAYARWAGLEPRLGVLSAGSTAICGASAAAAISSVLPRYPSLERDTAFTIIGVTTLSTVAMVLYPTLAHYLGLDGRETGLFIGATIHDVAQVVGAAYAVSTAAGDKATIVKLFRVALLLPTVTIIAWVGRRGAEGSGRTGSLLPGFLIAFAGLVVLNSVGVVPQSVASFFSTMSRWCIVVAIAALGVKTSLKSFFDVGRTAVAMMAAETLFLALLFLTLFFVLR